LEAGEFYNNVAGFYDALYVDPVSQMENEAVQEVLTPFINRGDFIIDIGCGTGLFLELFNTGMHYVGVDPSVEMLNIFWKKFPGKITFNMKYEDFDHYKALRTAIGLFGAPGYISPDHLDPTEYEDHFLMFYRPGYMASYYDKTNPEVKAYTVWEYNLHKSNLFQFTNYEVATSFDIKSHNLFKPIK
jgi:SAM-dependent methyltransferase